MNPALRNRLIGLVLAVLVYGVDQWVKWWVRVSLELPRVLQVKVLPFFDFTWTENYGVSLGLFTAESTEMRLILIAVTGAIALGVLVWLLRERLMADIVPLGLVLGGALGNITDRYRFGHVVDYADLHFGDFRPFLVFNIADAAITIGVLLILARSFLTREKPEAKADAAPET